MRLLGRVLSGLTLVACAAAWAYAAEENPPQSFLRVPLADKFFSEGATFADFNRDGKMDVVAGPYWYAGPDFKQRFEVYPPRPFEVNGYSDNFFAFAHDVDRDGWTDLVVVGFPGKEAYWYRNPAGKAGPWDRHLAFAAVDNESPAFCDLTGDGVPELVFHTAGRFGYAEIPAGDPTQPWPFHAISDDRGYDQFNHGLGVGDLNGDGRPDVLEKNGWWEQPAAGARDALWKFHRVPFAPAAGGAQMIVYDFDGDGDNDVVTSKNAHGYGLAWFEQVGSSDGGEIAFDEHLIMGQRPDESDYGVAFSQLHALALADVDGDGVQDFITGKRFWAHGGHDPGAHDPAVLYWFKTVREGGTARFVPYLIDNDSGVGTQVVAGDVSGDGRPDVVVSNKKGSFLFLQRTEAVDKIAREAAQPRPQPRSIAAAADQKVDQKNESTDGTTPKGANGKPLNLDFETGDLSDWMADGPAFAGQPIRGDTVRARRGDMQSGHAGNYWVGTYEVSQDEPQGTLTSASFEVTQPFASFLVGGGSSDATRVEIVREDNQEVVFKASGDDNERMHLAVSDLHSQLGKRVFVRVVDESSGAWGHVNFDHFRLHDKRPQGAAVAPLPAEARPPKDQYPFARISADQAAKVMKLPSGFSVKVFAAEPDVKQPIAMTLDDRGRVWIAEAYQYPIRAGQQGPRSNSRV